MWRSQEEVDIKLLYNSVRQEVQISWRSEFEASCCSWRKDAGMRTMSQHRLAPRPSVEQSRRTRKKCCYSQKSWGVNILQFCSVSNSPLTYNTLRNPFEPFKIKWGVDFSKELCPPVVIVLNMFLHASAYDYASVYSCICIM